MKILDSIHPWLCFWMLYHYKDRSYCWDISRALFFLLLDDFIWMICSISVLIPRHGFSSFIYFWEKSQLSEQSCLIISDDYCIEGWLYIVEQIATFSSFTRQSRRLNSWLISHESKALYCCFKALFWILKGVVLVTYKSHENNFIVVSSFLYWILVHWLDIIKCNPPNQIWNIVNFKFYIWIYHPCTKCWAEMLLFFKPPKMLEFGFKA